MKLKKKKNKKLQLSSKTHLYVVTMVFICLIEMIVICSFVFHPMAFRRTIASGMYTAAANWEIENSIIVKETVDFCRPFGIKKDLIKCVVSNVGAHYNYTDRNESNRTLIFVDDFATEGYLCRDIAVAYDAIFRELGLKTDYIFSRNHVYNNVYIDRDDVYLDCIINMDAYGCF